MDTIRIEQYSQTFSRLNSLYDGATNNFTRQKIANNIVMYAGIYEGLYAFAVEDNDLEIDLKNTSFLSLSKIDFNEKKAFIFSLNDGDLLPIFISFIVDLESIVEENPSATFIHIYNRFLFWVKMFKSTNVRMSDNQIMGLLNELLVLQDYLIPKLGVNRALKSWIGPELLHKDFTLSSGLWIEAKAINVGKEMVSISSIEQLESKSKGYLLVSEFEKTSINNIKALNLKKVISTINEFINVESERADFFNKLYNFGISYNDVFDEEHYINKTVFIHKSTRWYTVDEKFPKLTRKVVLAPIRNVRYELILEAIGEFLITNIGGIFNEAG